MSHHFKGTGVAIVTPFKSNKEVDFDALKRLIQYITDGGVEYIVVQGTTGESVTLTADEKRACLDCVLETNNGLLPVVLGIGGNGTNNVVKEIEGANLEGVDGILSVSPYYNKPTQEGIYQHYKAISSSTDLPIILYNVPARTGSNVLPETVVKIANDCTNIVAVKEASANVEQSMEIIRDKPEDFIVVSGDDALTLPLIASGAEGVISVVANAFPFHFSNMVRDCLASKFETAKDYHYALLQIIKYLFVEGNPGGIKAALKIIGVTGDDMRLPLVNVSDNTYKKLEELISLLPERE